jgi:O-antigen biosynthesis protein WbqP
MVRETFYTKYVKNVIDRVLGILGLICLSWLYAIIAIAIVIDDPGPVLFKQKRVGKKENGEITYFNILKFRSMKMSTPHDVPTHMLDNPEQYITRVGKILRKTSADELPQIWNIAIPHNLSIIGDGYIIGTTKENLDFSRVVTA